MGNVVIHANCFAHLAIIVTEFFEHLPSWLGYLTTALVAFGAYIQNSRKGDIDESTMVLSAWKNLVEQHQTDIKGIRDEFAIYKATAIAEIADLRLRLAKAEGRISELETENAGLKRAIAQNSQSTAIMLGRSNSRATVGDTRMDGMQDEISKLDQAGHNRGNKP